LNLEELKALFEILEESNITEFELEEEGVKLRVQTGGDHAVVPQRATPALPVEAGGVEPSPGKLPSETDPGDSSNNGLALVAAPMVGTFYRQPAPGAEPFARKGDRVEKGQTLCIIEAMKLMNEIESELRGELVEVYVEDGHPVQYGDKLFAIREA